MNPARQFQETGATKKRIVIIYRRKEIPIAKGASRVHNSTFDFYINATWNFAKCALWKNEFFTEAEIILSKQYIREFYTLIPAENFTVNAPKLFIQYCERILLARNYVNRFSHRFIPHPCIWLDRTYQKGFVGTKKWFDKISGTRIYRHDFIDGNHKTAELYAEYVMNGSAEVMKKASRFFNTKGNAGLLNLLCCSISNYKQSPQSIISI